MFGLGPVEVVLIGAIAVMLYGKRLPEVGRSVGQSIAELRRQWTTISRDLDVSSHLEGRDAQPARPTRRFDDEGSGATTAQSPRFDPPVE
ncbi:MAG: twin-arginine translocase TatA/TatE family subunit [Planctomycetota bacterium]